MASTRFLYNVVKQIPFFFFDNIDVNVQGKKKTHLGIFKTE